MSKLSHHRRQRARDQALPLSSPLSTRLANGVCGVGVWGHPPRYRQREEWGTACILRPSLDGCGGCFVGVLGETSAIMREDAFSLLRNLFALLRAAPCALVGCIYSCQMGNNRISISARFNQT